MTDDTATLRITEAELVTLLLLTNNAAATRTAHVLGLEPQLANGEIDRAGMQTLLVRELGVLEGDRFSPQGPAQVIAAIVGSATEWLVTTVDGPDVQTAVVVVASPDARLMVVVMPTGVHEVRPIDPTGPLTDVPRVLAESFAADTTYRKPLGVRIRQLSADTERTARFEIQDADTWRIGATLLATSGTPYEIWGHVLEALAR